VPSGTQIQLTVARGKQSVTVPDLRAKVEADALQQVVQAGLAIGTRSEAFDPVVALGTIISQDPGPGLIVAPGTPVSYVVSKGPEPSASPSPSPTPTLTPTPTPPPTPAPTPAPTPTLAPTPAPTPGKAVVPNYKCQTLTAVEAALPGDGLKLGTVTPIPGGTPDGTWIVWGQSLAAGSKQAYMSVIDLNVDLPATAGTCTP
jgi:beta-lactam-binding protein with PASTA domain